MVGYSAPPIYRKNLITRFLGRRDLGRLALESFYAP